MCEWLHAGLPSRQVSSHKHTVLTRPPVGHGPLRTEMGKNVCVGGGRGYAEKKTQFLLGTIDRTEGKTFNKRTEQ